MKVYLWIAIGSALGGMARHWATTAIASRFQSSFPWGTLLVNIIGSYLIGLVASLPDSRFPGSEGALLRQFLTIGLLGGFTTFSAFSLQSITLLQQGKWETGVAYIAASVLICLACAWLGYISATGSFRPGV